MGQTITQITYLTENGIYTIDCDVYVPVKVASALTVVSPAADDKSASVKLPDGTAAYQAVYTVTDASGADDENLLRRFYPALLLFFRRDCQYHRKILLNFFPASTAPKVSVLYDPPLCRSLSNADFPFFRFHEENPMHFLSMSALHYT